MDNLQIKIVIFIFFLHSA